MDRENFHRTINALSLLCNGFSNEIAFSLYKGRTVAVATTMLLLQHNEFYFIFSSEYVGVHTDGIRLTASEKKPNPIIYSMSVAIQLLCSFTYSTARRQTVKIVMKKTTTENRMRLRPMKHTESIYFSLAAFFNFFRLSFIYFLRQLLSLVHTHTRLS